MTRIVQLFLIASVAIAHLEADPGQMECEANAEPRPCGKLCEQTCERPRKMYCTPAKKHLCKDQCRCKDDYVRCKLTGKCIKVEDCPKPPQKCPRHESLALCGRICEPTCSNPNPKNCPRISCTKQTEACRCDEGYVRDSTINRCVRQCDCSKCGKNEQVGACGRICETTCDNRDPGKCAAISCTGSGCQCKEGFYRNAETDKCVPVDQCPKKCADGEINAPCGTTCEGTCKCPTLPEICNQIKCAKQDCRCDLDAGFVRDEETGKCVRKENCQLNAPEDAAAESQS